jgi:phosphatidylglycerol:prolipoprotein diacylglycerol transferase
LEGIVLFVILWLVKDRKLPVGGLLALFLMLYGAFRFFVEFFREPDPQLGFILGSFTMGQVLCGVMIGVGAGLMITLSRRN